MKTSSPRANERTQKLTFYRQPLVVAEYDRQRFGGASGAWVNEREITSVLDLLPGSGRILDLGCGTGRLSQRLVERSYDVILLDASDAMLARAVPIVGAPAVLGDAFGLPFAPRSFDAVVGLRLAFHFANLDGLVDSVAGVLRPGGRFVFDTYRWSPRAIVPLGQRQWGGKVHLHPESSVRLAAQKAGLIPNAESSCFLFSPYLYRRLPLTIIRGLVRAEKRLPETLRVRQFWSLEKPKD